jgi:adenosyl cobinamide kinase/adenosyl cobinamide phosphate guanylyltransferase
MIFLNIAMALFFSLLGAIVCYIAEEHKFDERTKNWIGIHKDDIEQQWVLLKQKRGLESELKKG